MDKEPIISANDQIIFVKNTRKAMKPAGYLLSWDLYRYLISVDKPEDHFSVTVAGDRLYSRAP